MGAVQGMDIAGLTCVTASHLARNFGHWQDVALRDPVYVVHRGRPRLALTSVDFLSELIGRHGEGGEWPRRRQALIDALDHPIAILDARNRLAASNAAMRGFLDLMPGKESAPLASLSNRPVVAALAAITGRVRATALVERVELDTGGDQPIEAFAAPVGDEVLLVLADLGARAARDQLAAELRAWNGAINRLAGCAAARINLRGYLAGMSPSLARLAGIAAHQPVQARLVSLFDTGSRARLGDALDHVLGTGVSEAVDATLLVGGADRLPVSVAIAPIAPRIAIEGAFALIVGKTG